MSQRLSAPTRWIIGIAFVFGIGAMLRYPGGTALDPTTLGYDMWGNFLSDLGMTTAYNHERNWLGAALFVVSLLLLVVGLSGTAARIARRLSGHPSAKPWARAAVAATVLAALAFAGVAVTPENQAMAVHVAFTLWAWRIIPIVAVLLTVASFRSPEMPRNVGPAWLILALLLASYALFLEWGPEVTTARGLAAQVVAQKLATAVVLAALLFVSHVIDQPLGTRAGRHGRAV